MSIKEENLSTDVNRFYFFDLKFTLTKDAKVHRLIPAQRKASTPENFACDSLFIIFLSLKL